MAYNRQTAIDAIARLAKRQSEKKDVEFKSAKETKRTRDYLSTNKTTNPFDIFTSEDYDRGSLEFKSLLSSTKVQQDIRRATAPKTRKQLDEIWNGLGYHSQIQVDDYVRGNKEDMIIDYMSAIGLDFDDNLEQRLKKLTKYQMALLLVSNPTYYKYGR